MKISTKVKNLETGDKLILVRNKHTGKVLWWNITKGMFAVINTPFMNLLKQKAQED